MCDYQDKLTEKYKKFPDEAKADAYDIQDACNLQAVAQTFMCMARACNFNYKDPAVIITLDKMNSLCHMQGTLFIDDMNTLLMDSYRICHEASDVRKGVREAEKLMNERKI
jgi:hypothetical protein